MAQPILGQILTFGGTFAPQGYMLCAGQLLAIAQYDALYSLIGTTYGGDGVNTFQLPDLRSRVPIHMGQGPRTSAYVIGQKAGVEGITLSVAQMPAHTHPIVVTNYLGGNTNTPSSSAYISDAAESPSNAAYPYVPFPNANQVSLATESVKTAGGSGSHDNRQPYQALNYCIAVNGIFPSRS